MTQHTDSDCADLAESTTRGTVGDDDGPLELPPQFAMLCDTLNKLAAPVWAEWDGLQRGHVHVARREVATFEAYRSAITTQVRELSDVVGTLGTVCNELVREALRGDPAMNSCLWPRGSTRTCFVSRRTQAPRWTLTGSCEYM